MFGPSGGSPQLSPDGKWIAFTRNTKPDDDDQSNNDIYVMPVTGGEARLLVSHPANESRPLYSPDGSRLAFTSTRTGNGDIYILTLNTGDLKRLTFDDSIDLLDGILGDFAYRYVGLALGVRAEGVVFGGA